MARRGRPPKVKQPSPFFMDTAAEAARTSGKYVPKQSSFDSTAFDAYMKLLRRDICERWVGPFVNFDLACRMEDIGPCGLTGFESLILDTHHLQDFYARKRDSDRKAHKAYTEALTKRRNASAKGGKDRARSQQAEALIITNHSYVQRRLTKGDTRSAIIGDIQKNTGPKSPCRTQLYKAIARLFPKQ